MLASEGPNEEHVSGEESEEQGYYGFAQADSEIEEQDEMSTDEKGQQDSADDGEGLQDGADDMQEYPADDEQQPPRRPRRPRTSTRWPLDKMTVTEVDEVGMPTERLAGLIARQRLSIVMPRFNCLSDRQKWSLFDNYVMKWLHFPDHLKEFGFKNVMKTTAKSWRTHKSNLVRRYISKGLEPFEQHPYIEPEDWEEFVQLKESEAAQAESERFRKLRERNLHNHSMGPIGYEGKKEQWEREDRELSAQGIPNPWDEYPPGRPTNWLRAWSDLQVSVLEGTASIRWKNETAKEMSKAVKEKHQAALSSGITFVRENDLLSSILGPEQPDRVRGVSSYNGWKHAWPEFSGMYRKRKMTSSVDLDTIKAEIRVEVTQDIMSMLAAQGLQLQLLPASRNPSPAPGRRSSCASASEAENINNNDTNHTAVENNAAENNDALDQMQEDVEFDTIDHAMDVIDQLTDPTPCSLIGTHDGYQVEVARGLVYTKQSLLHSVPILSGYAVVKFEMVCKKSEHDVLDPPPSNDEIKTLGQAMLQRIQWKRSCIIVNPPPIDHASRKYSKVASKSASGASLSGRGRPQKEQVIPTKSCPSPVLTSIVEVVASNSSKKDAVESVPKQQQNDACRTTAVTKNTKTPVVSSQKQKQQQVAPKVAPMTTEKIPASSKKQQVSKKAAKTICSQTAADDRSLKQQQQPAIGSQEPAAASCLKQQQQQPAIGSQEPAAASSLKKQCPPKASQKVPEARPSKKQIDAISSQNVASTAISHNVAAIATSKNKQPNKGVAKAWTMPNPKFKCGHPMLKAAELERVGPATAALHAYYLKGCRSKHKKDGIAVKIRRNHFLRGHDSECFSVGFNDLYDLFNLDALDVSLLCCFTLSMIVEAKANAQSVGFLVLEVLTVTTMTSDKSYVVDYVTKAFKHFAKKDCIMFAHNSNGHWLLVVVVPRWGKVLYLDSMRSQSVGHTMLKDVINESYLAYCRYKRIPDKVLVHAYKFPCHQQQLGNTDCGFYTAGHMMEAMQILHLTDPQDFEVSTLRFSDDVLSSTREKIASFIMDQVVDKKGEFHCPTLGINMLGYSQ